MKKYIFRKDHYFARISWLAYLLFYSLKCMSCRNNCAEKYNCKTVFGLKLDIFLTTELEGILRGGNGEGEKERERERGLIIECKVTKEIIRCSMTTSFISTRLPIADWVG